MKFEDVTRVLPPNWDEIKDQPKRPLILQLGQLITDRKGRKITYEDPEYYGLAAYVSDLEAQIGLTMKLRKEYTFDQMKKMTSKLNLTDKELEDTLFHMGWTGIIEFHYHNNADGTRDKLYVLPRFVMGSAEFSNMQRERIDEHPEVARFFERMTFDPLNGLTHMIPPGGAGIGMHVIPVESAIESSTSSVSIEHISHWLEKYDGHIAASPCSCTMCEEVLGVGSGRVPDEWCISVGDMADFCMETGKASRYITKEEALEIFRKAEENGYVHQITNNDGPDKIIAICNCDPKVCHALRTSQLFNTPNLSRSAYVAHVDKAKCVACGRCVEYCPAGAVKLGQKLCLKDKTEVKYPMMEDPAVTKWDRSKWSEEYNDTNRINTYDTGTAPCKAACPAHIAVQGYLKLASQGRYEEALELIKRNNPFPAVCGRVCNKRCEDACTRGTIDQAISIDAVKKFLAERDLDPKTRFIPKKEVPSAIEGYQFPQKIAIIGAGPAGLSAAYYLAIKGYKPTVFEKNPLPGGMLRYGIPSYKLEKNVIDAEIEVMKELGVEIKCNVEVGKDVTIEQLKQQGYCAFYLAIGCQGGRRPGVANDTAEGTTIAVDFLREATDNQNQKMDGEIIVVGGGNVAIDCARTAQRFGGKVSMFCLEDRATMPASKLEQLEAEEEGITIFDTWGPKEVKVDENGKVSGIVFKRCLRTIDPETNRFSPVYNEEETKEVKADQIIFAIGQSIIWGNLLDGTTVETRPNGAPLAEKYTYRTQDPQIVVGGDVYTGPKFVIDAIAAGKMAADSLHRIAHPGTSRDEGINKMEFASLDTDNIYVESYDNSARQEESWDESIDRIHSFKDAHKTLTEEQVKIETSRCLGCGASIVDTNKCIGCGICTTKCSFDAIHLTRDIPEASNMVPCEDTMKKVLPYVIKRQINIRKHNRELKKQNRK